MYGYSVYNVVLKVKTMQQKQQQKDRAIPDEIR